MKKFVIKYGISLEYIGSPLHINAGDKCILVFDENACVGIVWKHYEKRYSPANGQAEIRFFGRYKNKYNVWHRMFVNTQRLSYAKLEKELANYGECIYYGEIKYR